jgi:hypothetical protein
MFSKPISQLLEEDIQTLIDNAERESSILEYKQQVSGTDHEKKELAKDISAMANTEGGYLIIGIQEQDSRAMAMPGTDKKIGRQPVEAWIENILITNVRPKIAITPKVIELSSSPDKVVLVLHIPQSSRRPHMVIADGKNAYYIRHNYQAAYADEHEVRSLVLESKSSGDEMEAFLNSRHLVNSDNEDFALTPLSKQLAQTLRKARELSENFTGNPFVLFAACPRYLEERIDISSGDFRTWLDTFNTIELFDLGIDFLDYNKTISANSIRSIKEIRLEEERKTLPYRYVEVFRNGYVENGISTELMWAHEKLGLMFQLAYFTGALWLFLKFVKNLYEKIGYIDEFNLIIALADVENITLHGFGKKNATTNWVDPYDFLYHNNPPTSTQRNLKVERSIMASELNDDNIEEIVKDIAKRVSNAFGESIAKCFDDDGDYDKNQLRGFRNVR